MKGQFTWDYIVAFVAFIALVSYLALQIIGIRPSFTDAVRGELLRSEAYQISELLINNPGEPEDWTILNVRRPGFSNEIFNAVNNVSSRKAGDFNTICQQPNGYFIIAGLLGVDVYKYNFSVLMINKTSGFSIVNCRPPTTIARVINVTARRFSAIDGMYAAELIVQTW